MLKLPSIVRYKSIVSKILPSYYQQSRNFYNKDKFTKHLNHLFANNKNYRGADNSNSIEKKAEPIKLDITIDGDNENGGDCKLTEPTDVGVCMKVHFHFKEEELKTFHGYKYKGDNVKNTLDGKCDHKSGNEKPLIYPNLVNMTFNLKLEDKDNLLQPGQLNISDITVNGKISVSKLFKDEVYVFNGTGNCVVKC